MALTVGLVSSTSQRHCLNCVPGCYSMRGSLNPKIKGTAVFGPQDWKRMQTLVQALLLLQLLALESQYVNSHRGVLIMIKAIKAV